MSPSLTAVMSPPIDFLLFFEGSGSLSLTISNLIHYLREIHKLFSKLRPKNRKIINDLWGLHGVQSSSKIEE